jgi:hypothetical protein
MKYNLLVLVIFIFKFVGCSNKANDHSHSYSANSSHDKSSKVEMVLGEESAYKISDVQKEQIITLNIDKMEYRKDEVIKMTIKNNSETDIEFGADSEVETLIDQKWIKVDFTNSGVPAILHSLKSNKEFYKENHVVKFLKSGRYRLVQGVSTDGDSSEYEEYLISENFEVIPD